MKTEKLPESVVSRRTDDRRRFNMPDECPPNALLTVQQLDKGQWLVSLVKAEDTSKWEFVRKCSCPGTLKSVSYADDEVLAWPVCGNCLKWFELKKPSDDAPAVKVP